MAITVARLNNRYARIVRTQETVAFSPQKDWILLEYDFDKPAHWRTNVSWVPASTRFDWVRSYHF